MITSETVHNYIEEHDLSLAGFIACHVYSVLRRAFPQAREEDEPTVLQRVFDEQHKNLWVCCMAVNTDAIDQDKGELETLYTLATTHHRFFKEVVAERTIEKQLAKDMEQAEKHDRKLH